MAAVRYFHSKNIVHRDLKIDNIIIQGYESGKVDDLRVKIIDFGMSKLTQLSGKKINLNTWCGSIEFIAPEVFSGECYGIECDLWSVGVIAFFMLARIPPFLGTDD